MKNNNLTKYVNWLEEWNSSERTIELYTQSLTKFQQELTTTNIRSYLKEQLTKQEVNTVKITRQALSSYAKFIKQEIDWDKIIGLIPKIQQKFFATLTEKELKLLKNTRTERFISNYQRNNLILDFLFYTGIRVNELVNIKHSNWTNNQLRILGKGNKIRFIFVPPFLTNSFQSYSKGYLFTNQNGTKMLTKHIQRVVRQRVKKSGLNKVITPHSFRRSFATLLNKEGVQLTTISKLLGHSDINTIISYIHNDYQTLYQDYSKLWKNSEINKMSQDNQSIFFGSSNPIL